MSFYLGIGVVLMTAFCRYIDLVGNYIGASIFFLICGGALGAAARVWHNISTQQEPTYIDCGGSDRVRVNTALDEPVDLTIQSKMRKFTANLVIGVWF